MIKFDIMDCERFSANSPQDEEVFFKNFFEIVDKNKTSSITVNLLYMLTKKDFKLYGSLEWEELHESCVFLPTEVAQVAYEELEDYFNLYFEGYEFIF